MSNYVCVHGHFYQPPRENAWLEIIELQDSAYPYHDWNERIADECYAPNAVSRILDSEGWISSIVNNYSRMSFNIGPTLLSWMKEKDPETYRALLEADLMSRESFSGHGSAMAQAYSHMIMPLANSRDKRTQVIWGMADFSHRFKRAPEGMWLPETAVDLETLDIMAEQGIKFTILAPHQAKRVRPLDSGKWTDVSYGAVDTTRAYRCNLPSGRQIALFFYNGPLSREIAFDELLKSGESFANRLVSGLKKDQPTRLSHVATDGETYGHHHRFGDMALAYALRYIEEHELAMITNYGEFLEQNPPSNEVEIFENTSWSCSHGVERWRANCGCNAGRNAKWSQEWRAPLREALDELRDELAGKYETVAAEFLKDPWAARDEYIRVILDRSPENIRSFFEQHRTRELDHEDTVRVLKLLELQRHAMLMYTSCGWFFDELSGIETVQVIQYAGRAVQLARDVLGDDIEERFLENLGKAKSNIARHGDGRRIYDKFVRPAVVDLPRVVAHYAVSSLFEEYEQESAIFCYMMKLEDHHTATAGKPKLATGKVRVTSVITGETAFMSFGVLHLGDHNVNAGVREFQDDEAYSLMQQEIGDAFSQADFPGVIRLLDRHFGVSTYSIKDLFTDEQRKVLDKILEAAMEDIESAYSAVYEHHYPPMRFLAELGYPIPKSFQTAAEFILNGGLRRAISGETLDLEAIRSLLEEAQNWDVELDKEGMSYLWQQMMERNIEKLSGNPEDIEVISVMNDAAGILETLPFEVDLWKVQNQFHSLLVSTYPGFRERARQGDETASRWVDLFVSLGTSLSIRVG